MKECAKRSRKKAECFFSSNKIGRGQKEGGGRRQKKREKVSDSLPMPREEEKEK